MDIITYQLGVIGTNCYIAYANGEAVIVDPAIWDENLEIALAEHDLVLKYILLTHGHGDHIGGVAHLKRDYPDALVVCGRHEEKLVSEPNMNFYDQFGVEPMPAVDLWVADGDELSFGGETLRVIETPGHTPGGISFYGESSGVLFSGDTLFQTSIGRTDLPGGSYDEIIDSVRNKLFVLPDETKVLPGHMGLSTIGYEKAHNPFV
jgi:glyoxylase-like metal-dependent hydrolase (beta-lactamase superfamily II)